MYDPERAEALTRTKIVNTVISKEPKRDNYVADPGLGPGTYDAGDSFGTGAQVFTFPPSPGKEDDRISKIGLGPGHYDPERADFVIRTRVE